jgi:hypothetical protein
MVGLAHLTCGNRTGAIIGDAPVGFFAGAFCLQIRDSHAMMDRLESREA